MGGGGGGEGAVQFRSSKKQNKKQTKKTSGKYERISRMFMMMSLGGKHTRVYTTLLLGLVQCVNWVAEQVNAKGEF